MDKYYRKKLLEDLNKRESVIELTDLFILVTVLAIAMFMGLSIVWFIKDYII
jgi:hypothetical protein